MAAPAMATPRDADGEHEMVVCHATSSDTNPYVRIVVDVASTKLLGHLQHQEHPNKYNSGGSKRPDIIGDVDVPLDCPNGAGGEG